MEYLIIGGIVLIGFVILAIMNTGGKTLSGRATVLSKRMELSRISGGRYSGNNWNCLVTFLLADSQELELYVSQEEFRQLKEGIRGQVTWCRDTLSSFVPD